MSNVDNKIINQRQYSQKYLVVFNSLRLFKLFTYNSERNIEFVGKNFFIKLIIKKIFVYI